MTDGPTTPAKDPRAKRPTIANADVPSETAALGLPDVGEGASGSHFVQGTGQWPADGDGEGNGTADAADAHVPADPPNPADPLNREN